jgi:hypothetical protein
VVSPRCASAGVGTVKAMSDGIDLARRRDSFSKAERAKLDERRRRYRDTTPGERVESALALSELAAELRSGLRARGA